MLKLLTKKYIKILQKQFGLSPRAAATAAADSKTIQSSRGISDRLIPHAIVLASSRLSSVRFGLARLSSVRFGSARFDSFQLISFKIQQIFGAAALRIKEKQRKTRLRFRLFAAV